MQVLIVSGVGSGEETTRGIGHLWNEVLPERCPEG